MKEIKGLEEESHRGFFFFSDYNALINSFEVKTLLQVDDEDYQGDSRFLFKDGNRYGLLIFGWGSCSGCDALQGCDNKQEVIELRDHLFNEIIWKESKEELLKYIQNKDWKTDYSWHAEETKKFVKQSIELLQP